MLQALMEKISAILLRIHRVALIGEALLLVALTVMVLLVVWVVLTLIM